MWRVLVPLDGTSLSASVLPDARRLAGPGGTVILVSDAAACRSLACGDEAPGQAGRTYLDCFARSLEADGLHVETHLYDLGDPASAIERAVVELDADILTVATHALPVEERWQRGSVAWTALLRSTVPVLLRRGEVLDGQQPTERRILVPLDGSHLAEAALPLAQSLAVRWGAPIWLVQVVEPGVPPMDLMQSEAYLAKIGEGLAGDVHTLIVAGEVEDTISAQVDALDITDLVMTSHGKTGLTRAIVGSVADNLIHRVACPIIVIPPLLTLGETEQEAMIFDRVLVPV